jgi:hypothetical protein
LRARVRTVIDESTQLPDEASQIQDPPELLVAENREAIVLICFVGRALDPFCTAVR